MEILPPEIFELIFSYMKGDYKPFWNLNSRINQMILQETYWRCETGDMLDEKIKQGYIRILDTTKMFHLRNPDDIIRDPDAIRLKELCGNSHIDTLILNTSTLFLLGVLCNKILIKGCNLDWAQSDDTPCEQHIQSFYMYMFFRHHVKRAKYMAVHLHSMKTARVFSCKVLENVKFYLNKQEITDEISAAIVATSTVYYYESCYYLAKIRDNRILAFQM